MATTTKKKLQRYWVNPAKLSKPDGFVWVPRHRERGENDLDDEAEPRWRCGKVYGGQTFIWRGPGKPPSACEPVDNDREVDVKNGMAPPLHRLAGASSFPSGIAGVDAPTSV